MLWCCVIPLLGMQKLTNSLFFCFCFLNFLVIMNILRFRGLGIVILRLFGC